MKWREIVISKHIQLFPGEEIFAFGRKFEVFEVYLKTNSIRYKIVDVETGAAIVVDWRELEKTNYRRIEDETS